MRVCIEARSYFGHKPGGFRTYVGALVEGLSGRGVEVHCVTNVTGGRQPSPAVVLPPTGQGALRKVIYDQLSVPMYVRHTRTDLMHFPCNGLPRRLHRVPTVVTMHDTLWYRPARADGVYQRAFAAYEARAGVLALTCADALITVSRYSRERIDQLRKDLRLTTDLPVYVIYNGADRVFAKPGLPWERRSAIMCFASPDKRKRPELVLQSYTAAAPEFRARIHVAVVLSRKELVPTMRALALQCGVEPNELELLIEPPTSDLVDLMGRSLALVFPNRDEGFGLPVIEAMTAGTPVIGVRSGAVPEVGGDAVLYAGGTIVTDVKRMLERLSTDKGWWHVLSGRGVAQASLFQWERAMTEHIRVYEAVASGR